MQKIIGIFLLGLLMISGIGCSPVEQTAENNKKLRVVTTIFPVADLARTIGGDKVEVISLLPPGASPHTFESTPAQIKQVSRAQVLIEIGSGLDSWAGKLVQAANPGIKIVIVTGDLALLPVGKEEHEGHAEDETTAGDPHVWLDPLLVKEKIAPRIAEVFEEASPQNKEVFRGNQRQLQEQLEELHQEIAATVGNFTQKQFFSFHSTWQYFAHRYGLRELASVVEYPGQEPSARWLAQISRQAEASGVKVIFIEPQFNPQPAELVAREIGGKVFILDPIGGENLKGKNSYLNLMRYNLQVMKEALH